MADPDAQLQALVVAQGAERAALSELAVKDAADAISRFRHWYDSAAITKLVAEIVKDVETVQRRTASVTDAYLSRVASLQAGKRIPPVGRIDVSRLRGIPHADAYGRLADNFRYLISQHVEPEIAQERIVHRAEVIAEADATLAMRAQSQKFMVVHHVDGFRRVIHPEVSRKTGVCGLCLIAADRVYHVEELLPIHDGCNCTVAPIINGVDPGHTLNQKDLASIYKAAGSNRAGDLRKIRIQVHEHSELGPILANAAHHWRDAETATGEAAA